MPRTPHRIFLIMLLWAGVVGCGGSSGPVRIAFSGRVLVDGQAVEKGQVRFTPAPGTPGPAAASAISGGQYRFTRDDGPLAGNYIVTVTITGDAPIKATGAPANPQTGPKGGGVSQGRSYRSSQTVQASTRTIPLELTAKDVVPVP